jgi:hypothetical protein
VVLIVSSYAVVSAARACVPARVCVVSCRHLLLSVRVRRWGQPERSPSRRCMVPRLCSAGRPQAMPSAPQGCRDPPNCGGPTTCDCFALESFALGEGCGPFLRADGGGRCRWSARRVTRWKRRPACRGWVRPCGGCGPTRSGVIDVVGDAARSVTGTSRRSDAGSWGAEAARRSTRLPAATAALRSRSPGRLPKRRPGVPPGCGGTLRLAGPGVVTSHPGSVAAVR